MRRRPDKDGSGTLHARRQPDGERVADSHAIDVALLDVDPHPQIVEVDQRDDRLTRIDELAGAHGQHIDDAVDRRVQLGICQPDAGFRALRARGRLLTLGGLQLATQVIGQ